MPSKRTLILVSALTAVLGSGTWSCAFSDGQPWGEAEFSLLLSRGFDDRLNDEGQVRTVANYSITVDELELHVSSVSLESVAGESNGAAFDPANPPEGYSLCHNGHCHADDGSLPTYEEVALQLGESSGGAKTVYFVPVDFSASLSPSESLALTDCGEACYLEPGSLLSASASVDRLRVTGRAYDQLTGDAARLPTDGVEFVATLGIDQTFTALIDGTVGDGQPLRVGVALELSIQGNLFDEVDWSSFSGDSPLDLSTNDDFASAIEAGLMEAGDLNATITR
ncbi:MAG: hypothetical protein KC561_15235 [Myxococcales bacterium]|nr:hypothetical protein [Myxococcales bacterium]